MPNPRTKEVVVDKLWREDLKSKAFLDYILPRNKDKKLLQPSNLIDSRFKIKLQGQELPFPHARFAIDHYFEHNCSPNAITGSLPELLGRPNDSGRWVGYKNGNGPPWFRLETHGSRHDGQKRIAALSSSHRATVCSQLKQNFKTGGWNPVDLQDLYSTFSTNPTLLARYRAPNTNRNNKKKFEKIYAKYQGKINPPTTTPVHVPVPTPVHVPVPTPVHVPVPPSVPGGGWWWGSRSNEQAQLRAELEQAIRNRNLAMQQVIKLLAHHGVPGQQQHGVQEVTSLPLPFHQQGVPGQQVNQPRSKSISKQSRSKSNRTEEQNPNLLIPEEFDETPNRTEKLYSEGQTNNPNLSPLSSEELNLILETLGTSEVSKKAKTQEVEFYAAKARKLEENAIKARKLEENAIKAQNWWKTAKIENLPRQRPSRRQEIKNRDAAFKEAERQTLRESGYIQEYNLPANPRQTSTSKKKKPQPPKKKAATAPKK